MNIFETEELEALRHAIPKGVKVPVYSEKYEQWFESQEIKDKCERFWYEQR